MNDTLTFTYLLTKTFLILGSIRIDWCRGYCRRESSANSRSHLDNNFTISGKNFNKSRFTMKKRAILTIEFFFASHHAFNFKRNKTEFCLNPSYRDDIFHLLKILLIYLPQFVRRLSLYEQVLYVVLPI